MRLRRAYTAKNNDGPILIFEFEKGGPATFDLYGKPALLELGGILVLEALNPDDPLEGFETLRLQADPEDPTSWHEFQADGTTAATRDPLAVKLAREFRDACNDLTFKSGIQVFPISQNS